MHIYIYIYMYTPLKRTDTDRDRDRYCGVCNHCVCTYTHTRKNRCYIYTQERSVIRKLGGNVVTGTGIDGQHKGNTLGKSDRAYHLPTTSDTPTIQLRRCVCAYVCVFMCVCYRIDCITTRISDLRSRTCLWLQCTFSENP